MQSPSLTRPPLAPATSTRLNSSATSSKKRKRDATEEERASGINIVTRPYKGSVSPSTATAVFSPVVTCAKADLPLIWLDTTSLHDAIPSGYLFEAAASVLQILAPKQSMVARLSPNGGLYVLEKTQDTVYIALLLKACITEESCRAMAVGEHRQLDLDTLQAQTVSRAKVHERSGSISSATHIRPPTPSSPKQPKNRKGAMARRSILTPRESQETVALAVAEPHGDETPPLEDDGQQVSQAREPSPIVQPLEPSLGESTSEQGNVFEVQQIRTLTAGAETGIPIPPVAQNPTEEIHHHYLEALYARTPLAFYAKGPLGRARGMLRDAEICLTMEELSELYASMILPSKKLDTKYKESIPLFLKSLSTPGGTSEAKKRKNAKKVKLGKDCLYPDEHELLRKWWDERNMTSAATTFDTQVKRIAEELRNREAEMQLLLMLEALMLDIKRDSSDRHLPKDPEIKVESVEGDETVMSIKPEKRRKKRDFNSEIDALLDRLCIWHTVTLDDFLVSPEKASSGPTMQTSKDKLKEFCTDIIVPFYASKLPDQVKNICKKLGGPNISPHRPSLSRSRSMGGSKQKTHSLDRTASAGTSSLQRVLSQDHDLRHASPPVLAGSSSSHRRSGSTFKREPSEIMSRPSSRASMQKSVSFSNREIDLDADAKLQETKRRKLEKVADQKKELAAAIEALKRPNRTNTAKAIMDEAEKRAEPKLQINATPRKGRAHSTGLNSHNTMQQSIMPEPELEPVIPPSTIKGPSSMNSMPRPSAKKRAVLSAIHDTPSRGQEGRTSDPMNLSTASMNASRSAFIMATPSANRIQPNLPLETPVQPRMTQSGKPVLFTPLKRSDVSIEQAFRDAPEIPVTAGKAMDRVMGGKGREMFDKASQGGSALTPRAAIASGEEPDLYAQLGWDDDFGDI